MNSDGKLYRKRGKHYVEVGYEFSGFPCDGVWIVTREKYSKSRRCIAFLGEAPNPLKLASIARHEDALAKMVIQYLQDASRSRQVIPSAQEIARFTIVQLAQLLHEEEIGAKQTQSQEDKD